MNMVEKLMQIFRHDSQAVERMTTHTEDVSHDLTNLKARMDVLSRLVEDMRDEPKR